MPKEILDEQLAELPEKEAPLRKLFVACVVATLLSVLGWGLLRWQWLVDFGKVTFYLEAGGADLKHLYLYTSTVYAFLFFLGFDIVLKNFLLPTAFGNEVYWLYQWMKNVLFKLNWEKIVYGFFLTLVVLAIMSVAFYGWLLLIDLLFQLLIFVGIASRETMLTYYGDAGTATALLMIGCLLHWSYGVDIRKHYFSKKETGGEE